jgi:hypothetical protein
MPAAAASPFGLLPSSHTSSRHRRHPAGTEGRDWSCFRNAVNITASSAVGAAFSAGAGAVCGGAVCAVAPELNAMTPASTAIPVYDLFACDIAISFFWIRCGMILGLNHCEAAGTLQIGID